MRSSRSPADAAGVSAVCGRVPVPAIWSRRLVLLLMAEFGLLAAFYLLVSVVPLYAARNDGGEAAAGLATGAMMLSTVVAELVMPPLLARYGYRTALITGAALLGLPVLILLTSPGLPVLMVVCLVRGAGLGIVVVAGPALAAELVPAERRGEGLGLYGVAVGVPSVLGLPLGVWLATHAGFDVVFGAGAVIPLATLAPAAGLPGAGQFARAGVPASPTLAAGRASPDRKERQASVLSGLRHGGLARPALIFGATTLEAGVIVTFLPLAVPAWSGQLSSLALLAYAGAAPVARWATGRYSDRRGSGRLLIPAMLATAAGSAGLFVTGSPAAVLIGMALFGGGFGAAQNVTLALMLERAPRGEFGNVSALWNLAYDAGMGVGAVGFGLLTRATGYLAGFALTTAVLLAALIPAWRDRVRAGA
jgi:predicted MFS family arabinose efflux permease